MLVLEELFFRFKYWIFNTKVSSVFAIFGAGPILPLHVEKAGLEEGKQGKISKENNMAGLEVISISNTICPVVKLKEVLNYIS